MLNNHLKEVNIHHICACQSPPSSIFNAAKDVKGQLSNQHTRTRWQIVMQ